MSTDPALAFDDYDRLSDLGRRQAAALGDELVEAGVRFDRVYRGPAERHRETGEGVAAAYVRAGRACPAATTVDHLGEHLGPRVGRAELHTHV